MKPNIQLLFRTLIKIIEQSHNVGTILLNGCNRHCFCFRPRNRNPRRPNNLLMGLANICLACREPSRFFNKNGAPLNPQGYLLLL